MENIFLILFKKECAHMHFTQMSKITFYIIIIKSDKFLNWRNQSRTLKVHIIDSQIPHQPIGYLISKIVLLSMLIVDRPRDYPSSYSSLTVGMIGPDTPCLELQQSYHSLSTILNKFHIITHISQSHYTTQHLAYCCATIIVQPTRQHVLQLSSKT